MPLDNHYVAGLITKCYFMQAPDLIWVRASLWLWVLVTAKAVALMDNFASLTLKP